MEPKRCGNYSIIIAIYSPPQLRHKLILQFYQIFPKHFQNIVSSTEVQKPSAVSSIFHPKWQKMLFKSIQTVAGIFMFVAGLSAEL